MSHRSAFAVAALLALVAPTSADEHPAVAYLVDAVSAPAAEALPALAALRSTEDERLAPLFAALLRHADKHVRLFAASSMHLFDDEKTRTALRRCFREDPVMAVRSEAMLALDRIDDLTDQDLLAGIGMGDESIRCLAARMLVRRGKSGAAVGTLETLAESTDPATAALARMSLLGMDRYDRLDAIERTLTDDETPDGVVAMLMDAAAEGKVRPAAPLVRKVALGERSPQTRLRACRAVSVLAEDAPARLTELLLADDNPIFRVGVLRVLADRDDAAGTLPPIADSQEGIVAALARFELARPAGDDAARAAALEAAAMEHPIVLDYLLARAAEDLEEGPDRAAFYAPALRRIIDDTRGRGAGMRPEHFRAARAATLLADLGTPEARANIEELLSGRYSARTRAVAAGMLRTDNERVCRVMVGLLDSPFQELSTDAALVLGRFGRAEARKPLTVVVAESDRRRPGLVVLASWYLLRVDGRCAPAALDLVDAVAPRD